MTGKHVGLGMMCLGIGMLWGSLAMAIWFQWWPRVAVAGVLAPSCTLLMLWAGRWRATVSSKG